MYDIDLLFMGKKLKYYRKAKNMSIEDLGNIIGKSKSTIDRYEKRRNCNGYNYSFRNM
ncbi:MAG: helix-turn-helix domain-containing protein [Clostridia bacterium]